MKGIAVWVRNLTGYILFMAVLDQIMPGKEKGKYIRLFSGMVLLILLIQPFAGPAGILNRAAHLYQELELRYDANQLKEEILMAEQQKYSQILKTYEAAIAGEVTQMSEKEGYEEMECRVVLEQDRKAENFGQIQGIYLRLRPSDRPAVHTVSYLQKRIAEEYGLEENDVQIQVFTGQG